MSKKGCYFTENSMAPQCRALWGRMEAAEALNREMRKALEWIAHEAGQYADGADDAHYLAKFLTVVEQRALVALKAQGEST